MANAKVVHVTRESVTLAWEMLDGAAAYLVARVGPIVPGSDPENRLLATCYEPTFCDATLTPGARYVYVIELVPAPGAADVEEDRQRIGVRTLPETEFPNSMEFFERFLRPTFPRALDEGTRWCRLWWEHPEAVYVVEQLWASYEALRPPDPPEMPGKQRAEWLVAYFYPLFERLLFQHGPFNGCAINALEMGGRWHGPKSEPLLHDPKPPPTE